VRYSPNWPSIKSRYAEILGFTPWSSAEERNPPTLHRGLLARVLPPLTGGGGAKRREGGCATSQNVALTPLRPRVARLAPRPGQERPAWRRRLAVGPNACPHPASGLCHRPDARTSVCGELSSDTSAAISGAPGPEGCVSWLTGRTPPGRLALKRQKMSLAGLLQKQSEP
jgi:hypothetical protein